EVVLDADLVIEVPKIVVLGVEIHAQVGRAGRGLVVDLQPRVQGQLVLDLECEFAGVRLRAGADDGINLPVAAGIGVVQFALQDVRVEQRVRLQARQGAHHVVGTEVAVAGNVDGGEPAFGDLHFHRGVGKFLLGQADGHGDVTAFAIRLLQFNHRRANPVKAGVGAESTVHVGDGLGDSLRRQNGIAHDQIFVHGK